MFSIRQSGSRRTSATGDSRMEATVERISLPAHPALIGQLMAVSFPSRFTAQGRGGSNWVRSRAKSS